MSYIDTFDNEFVGYFGGLPVYHPLETVPNTPAVPRDFGCSPDNLVIGGGAGEHPAIVIKSPSEAAMFFLKAFTAESNSSLRPEQRALLQPIVDNWWNDKSRLFTCPWARTFDFAGWKVADYVKFATRCTSSALPRPFDSQIDERLEQWLAASMGEFTLLAMPELVPDVVARLGDSISCVYGGEYQNVLLVPPGYRTWGRREIAGQVTWGISAWRIERHNHPLTER